MAVSLTIEDVPEGIVEQLRERARQNHRSLQGELFAILKEALVRGRLSPDEAYAQIKNLGLATPSESQEIVRKDRDAVGH